MATDEHELHGVELLNLRLSVLIRGLNNVSNYEALLTAVSECAAVLFG